MISSKEILQELTEAQAILFDFDGVILDSEWPIYQTWKRLFAREGQELPQEQYVNCIGSNFDVWSPQTLLEKLTGKSFEWEQENATRQRELTSDLNHARPMPGVSRLLKHLSGKPMAVVSSSSHNWVDGWLKQLELMPHFQTTVCRGDAPKIKPDPDLFLEAAKQLNVPANNCLVVEDSLNGMRAAHSAGMKVLAVPSRLTHILDFSEAEWVTESLEL
jgi:HAD superfamily hydrolase (TIGR01509 family)